VQAKKRLRELRSEGLSWAEVAARMNAEKIPSGSGKPCWHPYSPQRLCPAA
jgi:hypothetical protein